MYESLKLPVGIENFEEIRTKGYYYVDKTKLIEQLFDRLGKVNLFTRPRRFGKTLNMSMLRYFFEIGTDAYLFDGLYHGAEICEGFQLHGAGVSTRACADPGPSLSGVSAE